LARLNLGLKIAGIESRFAPTDLMSDSVILDKLNFVFGNSNAHCNIFAIAGKGAKMRSPVNSSLVIFM
jgi:hypothetical protein